MSFDSISKQLSCCTGRKKGEKSPHPSWNCKNMDNIFLVQQYCHLHRVLMISLEHLLLKGIWCNLMVWINLLPRRGDVSVEEWVFGLRFVINWVEPNDIPGIWNHFNTLSSISQIDSNSLKYYCTTIIKYWPNKIFLITHCRNLCRAGWECGFLVTSKSGSNKFLMISSKFFTNLLHL